MQIKRFEAADVQEALKRVKEAMGPDALILSTKTITAASPQAGGLKRKVIEVVAATDRQFEPSFPLPGGDAGRHEETALLQRLMSTGWSPDFVHELMKEMPRFERCPGKPSPAEALREYLRRKLMESFDVTGPASRGTEVWAFIGPTGVGKTTTLAKLAAHFHLKEQKKVTLISIDTYRIGAVDQLRIYADILKLPLEIASRPEDLKRIVEENLHQDLLLIDTVGRSPNDAKHLEELRGFLDVHPRVESHLLLSATTKDRDLGRIVERFRCVPIKSYVFTKLDETDEYSPLLNQLLRERVPLSYLTTGQNVPEDLELATKSNVAGLFMNAVNWN